MVISLFLFLFLILASDPVSSDNLPAFLLRGARLLNKNARGVEESDAYGSGIARRLKITDGAGWTLETVGVDEVLTFAIASACASTPTTAREVPTTTSTSTSTTPSTTTISASEEGETWSAGDRAPCQNVTTIIRVTAPAPECLCPTVEPAATTQEPAGTTAAPTTTTTAAVETSAATTTTAAGAESTGVAHTIRAAKAVAEKIKSTVSSPSANIRDGVGGQAKAEAVPCEGWYGIGAASLCGAVFFVTSILVGPLGFYIGRRERHRSVGRDQHRTYIATTDGATAEPIHTEPTPVYVEPMGPSGKRNEEYIEMT